MVPVVPAVQIVQAVLSNNAKLEASKKRELMAEALRLFGRGGFQTRPSRLVFAPYSVHD